MFRMLGSEHRGDVVGCGGDFGRERGDMTHDDLKAAAAEAQKICRDAAPHIAQRKTITLLRTLAAYAAAMLDDNSHVAWCRYTDRTIVTCDSDAEGAFRVYRSQELRTADSERLARQVAELNRRYDRALAALRKIQKAYRRIGWEHGPTMEEAIDSVDAILTDEKIEADIESGRETAAGGEGE